jgi:serine/threonine-protein kinase
MAPEQARGKPIDKRVDVWAFGCVLFECLTGKRAFDGETMTDVLAAVLEREPDWSRLPATTPPHVHALLVRCFTRDPRARLRDIGEARLTLGGAVPVPASATGSRRGALALVALASLVVGSAVTAWWRRAPPATPAPSAFRQLNLRPEAIFARALRARRQDGRLQRRAHRATRPSSSSSGPRVPSRSASGRSARTSWRCPRTGTWRC